MTEHHLTGQLEQPTHQPIDREPAAPAGVLVPSVWACAQRARATQRGDRYAPGTEAHPAPTLPDLAGSVIERLTQREDWVLDPMCGIGTTVIEAVTRERRALGIDSEKRWTEIARASLEDLRRRGVGGQARVVTGDARQVDQLVSDQLHGQVGLLFCAPPYGPIHTPPDTHTSSEPLARPGVLDRHRLRDSLTQVLVACRPWLRPGGHVVLTIRPWRTPGGELLDLPADVLAAGQRAGLIPRQRCAVLLARLGGGRVWPRASATHRAHITRLRAGGQPAVVLAHHDLFWFTTPTHSSNQPTATPSTASTSAAAGDGDAAGQTRSAA